MSNQKHGIIAIVAAVMVVWAAVQSRIPGGKHAEQSGPAYLVQGLDQNAIASIVVGQAKDAIKIQRRGTQFVVVNEVNYPADAKQISDLVTKSLDIKTSEVYTTNPKNHEDLEVAEAKAKHVLKFFKQDGSLLAGVVIGKSQENGQDTYVRLASSDTVFVAQNVPWFKDRALDYVNQEIVTVKREDVNTVTVSTPEGAYTLRPQGSDGAVLADLPADRKLKDSEATSVLNALSSLRFDDVNTPADVTGLTFDSTYVCRLKDSTEYKLQLAKKGTKTYLICEAQYTDPTKVTINPNEKDSPEELKKKEAKLQAQEHALKFTARHKGWIYEVPDWKAKYLMMSRSGLLEDVKKEAEAKAADPNQPAAAPPAQPTVQPQPAQPQPPKPQEPPAAAPQSQPPSPAPAVPPAPAPEPNKPPR
ncbi:MAG: DUF4340 domain-containing protein [Planctomycetaceae bacterium]|nr:MAG: DUF4340 domain-containing protein [Planctomycetaceae bacterium]